MEIDKSSLTGEDILHMAECLKEFCFGKYCNECPFYKRKAFGYKKDMFTESCRLGWKGNIKEDEKPENWDLDGVDMSKVDIVFYTTQARWHSGGGKPYTREELIKYPSDPEIKTEPLPNGRGEQILLF